MKFVNSILHPAAAALLLARNLTPWYDNGMATGEELKRGTPLLLHGFIVLVLLLSAALPVHGQTNPVNVMTVDGVASGPMVVSGKYLYAGSALRIFDLSNPANPVDVGYNDQQGCTDLAVSSHYAYVISPPNFRILDVSNPTNPIPVGHLDGISSSRTRVTVAGHYAYLADAASSICDISDPANPVIVGQLPLATSIAVVDNYAYLSSINPNGEGLRVFDVSNPTNPVSIAFVHTPLDTPKKVVAAGNCLYLTAYSFANQSFWIFDISMRTNPVICPRNYEWSYDVAVSGNYLYLIGSPLAVYDVTDPTNAHRVAYVPIDGDGYAIAIAGNFAYIAFGGPAFTVWWLGSLTPPPLEIHSAASNTIALSWAAPAAAFDLQQNSDLAKTNWVTLTNPAVTIASRNQVVLPQTMVNTFYRLVSR
jgi:hypothetical protein